MISALKDIIANGWKSENGFRTGYLVVLERVMVQAFPGTDLRAQPHINSKLHVWKKYHASLTCMLALRGFSWNAKEKMVKAQDGAWDLYLKVDSSARTMRYKSWPFYEDWCQIYGSDIPILRENIEDLADADQEIKTDTVTGEGKEMAAVWLSRPRGLMVKMSYLCVIHNIVAPKRSNLQRKERFQVPVLMLWLRLLLFFVKR